MERKPLAALRCPKKIIKKPIHSSSNSNLKALPLFLSSTFLAMGGMITDTVFAQHKADSLVVLEVQEPIAAAPIITKPKKTEKTNIAIEPIKSNTIAKNYLPYIQAEGYRLFNVASSKAAIGTNLFIPIWQEHSNLVFTDLRIFDPSGKAFAGHIQLGYRHLTQDNHNLYGIYGSFDRKRSSLNNYFNQITLGGEIWLDRWFIGGNVYKPIGTNSRDTSHSIVDNGTFITTSKKHEEALPGIDAEIGYDFTQNITGYAGGYYFSGKDNGVKYGPKARITYDLSLDNGRILGIFDKIGFEAGVKHDKPIGTVCYLSTNVRVGWLPKDKTELQGVVRHMVDPIRRNADIATITRDVTEVLPSPNLAPDPLIAGPAAATAATPSEDSQSASSSTQENPQTSRNNDQSSSTSAQAEPPVKIYSEEEIKPAEQSSNSGFSSNTPKDTPPPGTTSTQQTTSDEQVKNPPNNSKKNSGFYSWLQEGLFKK